MKEIFEGWLFNRMEKLGGATFNHVGCKGKDKKFIDFLTQFVPETGMQRKVKFVIETQENIEKIKDYKIAKYYNKEEKHDRT